MSNDKITNKEFETIKKIVGNRSLVMNARIYGDIAITGSGLCYANEFSDESKVYLIHENVSMIESCHNKNKKGTRIYPWGNTKNR
ncbi:hypothetical protein [Leuconostoc mesenteroides]|uniref:hypothetical protein n=1 Tax=Leuconostoc mesenteroides TaxID=1245 RepID=UPI002073434B|nr:hypothetical protein [Leuconostoc mesenteroides]MCM6827603.1 hypothetical protein [Leuconostoc mesenteroides]